MKNFFRKLHLWVSVPFGLVITITCFTGALLVFESDIIALCNEELTSVEPEGEPLPVDELVDNVIPCLDEGVTVTGVEVSSDPETAYKVNLSKPHRAAVYVDQYTGEVKGKYERPVFFDAVRRLHRWLFDTAPEDGGIYWGKIIVGASTLSFVFILLTGIVIWWPRNRKMLKNRLQISVKKGKNRFWYDLHVAGGFYAVLFLLAMALTGLTWSFEWYRNGFYGMMGIELSQDGGKKSGVARKKNGETAVAEVRECPGDCSKCDGVPCGKNPAPAMPEEGATDASAGATVQADAVSGATVQADAVTGATLQADAVSGATVQADASTGATVQADAVSGATVQADAVSGATLQADAISGATVQADAVSGATVQADASTGATVQVDAVSGATAQMVPTGVVDRSHWQDALDNVLEEETDFVSVTVSDGMVSVVPDDWGNQRASDKYAFDKSTGRIISETPYEE